MLTQRGQSYIEILVAMGIFTIVSTTVFLLFFGGQTVLVDSQNAQRANDYASEGSEAVRSIRDRSWSELSDGFHGVTLLNDQWYFSSSTSDVKDIFNRTVEIATIDSSSKIATTTITWATDPFRTQQIQFVELLTSWSIYIDTGGDTGGSGIDGDWRNPQTLGSIDLGPGNAATDLDVKDKIVYISAEASSAAKPDFFIFDATNGASPQEASSLDVGSKGLNGIDTANNYAYGANQDVNAQLKVINVGDIDNPSVSASLKLSGVSGSGAIGNTIFYFDEKIYIGTKQATGPEFHVINVSTPGSPSSLGNYEVGADINDIYIVGTTAYLATSHDSKEVIILDVSNPGSISEEAFYNITGSEDGKSVYPVGTNLYVGSVDGSYDFSILDISDLDSISQLSAISTVGGDVNDIAVRDNLAFLGSSNANSEFQVWNISILASPTLWSSFNFPQVASGIDFENNIVYVGVRSNDALRIITSQ